MHVIVIGAGAVGISIAANLAEHGAQVTVLERGSIGAGTTATSYAWVNSNGKEPQAYFALNAAGVKAHHELASGGSSWFVPGGHLEVAADEGHARHLAARIQRMHERGYPVQELTAAQAHQLLPDLQLPPGTLQVAFFPEEGHVFPQLYLGAMLTRARAAGVRIHPQTPVTALEPAPSGALVHIADGQHLEADAVVMAAGRWTQDLAAAAGAQIPLARFSAPGDVTVGYLATTNPVPVCLDRLLTTPRLNVRPDGGGRLLLQALDLDVTADPGQVPAPDSALAAEFLHRLREVLPSADGAQIERLVVGQRVMPADGLTIVGPSTEHPWLYLVATHSGITLAPFLGQAVAQEVLGGHEPLFDDFRPSRFLEGAVAAPPVPRRPGEQ